MAKRLIILLGLAVIFCLIMFSWAVRAYGSSPWQEWQTKYFQARIAELQGNMSMVRDEEQARKLKQEIKEWQDKKPAVQVIRLPDGRLELCRTCHLGIEEISPSHSSDSIGCTVCHGGNPLSLDEKTAHAGMYGGGHPGRLDVAGLSCGGGSEATGQCHSGQRQETDNQVDLMATSLMAGKGGELSMTRYMYGLDIPPRILLKPGEIAAGVPAPFNHRAEEPLFKQNCLSSCHQGGGELLGQNAQANGCESCHVISNWQHTYEGQDVTMRGKPGHGMVHSLTVQIPYTQCDQCHNQGEYNLYTMHFTPRPDLNRVKSSPGPDKESLATRWQNVYSPGLVFTKCEVDLDCIDCHTRQEAMGDGEMHFSEWDALKIQCRDCHGTQTAQPLEWKITDKSDLAWAEARINPVFPPLKMGDVILKTAKGEELPYVRLENGKWFLYRKTNGEKYQIPQVIGSKCRQDPDKQSSDDCHKCHDVSKDKPS